MDYLLQIILEISEVTDNKITISIDKEWAAKSIKLGIVLLI